MVVLARVPSLRVGVLAGCSFDHDKDEHMDLREFKEWIQSFMREMVHEYIARLASDTRFLFTSPESLGAQSRYDSISL